MSRNILTIAFAAITAALAARAQSPAPGSILTASAQLNGTATVSSSNPGGCTTRICTTNMVTYSRCFTNRIWKLVCTTNSAGQIQCTNMPVSVTYCFTNTFPKLSCTNEVLAPASMEVREEWTAALTAAKGCDEVFSLFPTDSVLHASVRLNARTNDWAGTESGTFHILSGTNVLASGALTGVTGLGAPVAGGPCGVCSHFQGTLVGAILAAGPVPGARLQANFAGDLTGVTCPSSDLPQGAFTMLVNGVATTPCFSFFDHFEPDAQVTAPATY